jgi:hypothetical protein
LGLVWKDLGLKIKRYEFWKLELISGKMEWLFWLLGWLLLLTGLVMVMVQACWAGARAHSACTGPWPRAS